MTYVSELASQVAGSLTRNRLRTVLTMAGIAWGVASMVLIAALGESFKQGQINSMKTLGDNIVILFPGRTELQAGGQRAGRNIRLNYSDLENIRRECWRVKAAAAELQNTIRATSEFNSGSIATSGVEWFFPRLRSVPIADGRFFTDGEERERARVCVMGLDVKKQLFGERANIVGREIALNSIPYRIVGVMANKDQNSSYSGFDEQKIFIPYTSMTRDAPPVKNYEPGYLNDIIYQPWSLEDFAAARKQVMKVIARAHGFDPADQSAVHVWDTVENQRQIAAVMDSMTLFLSVVAAVTLVLGGVGVMNIMLVTVSERTREIGLRKALGATRLRIMVDFLAEGCALAFASGAIGWSFAFALSSALRLVRMPDVFPGLPVSWLTSAIAFATLTVIALASASVPAWRAASLTPVEALRDER